MPGEPEAAEVLSAARRYEEAAARADDPVEAAELAATAEVLHQYASRLYAEEAERRRLDYLGFVTEEAALDREEAEASAAEADAELEAIRPSWSEWSPREWARCASRNCTW